jgi:hypothetical protein
LRGVDGLKREGSHVIGGRSAGGEILNVSLKGMKGSAGRERW